ncbi:hypothetical protein J6590_036133, partial [Homalodisca vitripennis]
AAVRRREGLFTEWQSTFHWMPDVSHHIPPAARARELHAANLHTTCPSFCLFGSDILGFASELALQDVYLPRLIPVIDTTHCSKRPTPFLLGPRNLSGVSTPFSNLLWY